MLRTDDRVTPLSYDNIERLGKYRGNLLYRHSFSKTSLLDVKARYFDYSSDYKSEIDSRSKMREGSGEILYQRRAIDLWENPLDLTFDYRASIVRILRARSESGSPRNGSMPSTPRPRMG